MDQVDCAPHLPHHLYLLQEHTFIDEDHRSAVVEAAVTPFPGAMAFG
jgi:hypothetical protein